MKKLLLILFLFPLLATAQNIKGFVLSEQDNKPIENTNIFAFSSKSGTITNAKGEFSINLLSKFKDDEILEFSHIGYVTQKYSLNYLAQNNYKIFLKEEVQNLSGVTIAGTHKLKIKLAFNHISDLKYPVFAFGSFLKDNKIYVNGGDPYAEIDYIEKVKAEKADPNFQDFFSGQNTMKRHYKKNLSIYDIRTNSWSTLDIKLYPRGYHNIHFYNNSIYIVGGKKVLANKNSSWEYLQNEIEVVDLQKNTVARDKANPHQAADFASFSYKDNIIIIGGSVKMTESGKKDFTNKVHLYNITSGYWYELPEMLTAKETTGILIDDKIYVIGGNDGKLTNKFDSFDLITEKWQTEGELFEGLERPAIAHSDDIIYFFEDRKMFTYDLKSKLLKEYEVNLPFKFSSMFYSDEKLYILGGRTDNSYSKIPSAKIFTISKEEFKTTKPTRIKSFSQGINISTNNG